MSAHTSTAADVSGGVFDPSLPGGRQPARIEVGVFALTAHLEDGTALTLPTAGLRLERGGADGDLLFCRNDHAEGRIVYAKARDLLPHLRGKVASDALAESGSEPTHRATRLWVGLALLIGGLVLAVWLAIHSAAEVATWLPISVDQEIGKAAQPLVLHDATGKVVIDPKVTEPVKAVMERVVASSENPKLPWELTIVRSDTVNAFALPGGYVVVFTGLLKQCQTPDELAAVLGHEWTHVTRRHGIRRIGQSVGTVLLVDVVIGNIAGVLQSAAELFSLTQVQSYGREQEEESDLEAVHILHRAGLDPKAVARFFELLAKSSPQTDSGALSWLSTHPSHTARIEAATQAADRLGPPKAKPLLVDWSGLQGALR